MAVTAVRMPVEICADKCGRDAVADATDYPDLQDIFRTYIIQQIDVFFKFFGKKYL